MNTSYINKEAYVAFKILSVIGMIFSGILSFIMIMIIGMDLTDGNAIDRDFLGLFIVYFTVFLLSYRLNNQMIRVNMYNSLFVNDPDGVLQLRVLAKAMGCDPAKLKKEFLFFKNFRLMEKCDIEEGSFSENIVLARFNGDMGWEKQPVICKNCGAENHVRPGYVYSCSYCGSALGKGRYPAGRRGQKREYISRAKMIAAGILSGIMLLFFSILEFLLILVTLVCIAESLYKNAFFSELGDNFIMVMTAIFIGSIWFVAFRILMDTLKAGKLNRMFLGDEDGLVAMSDAARHLHMKQSRFFFYFYKLVGKKKLINCSVFSEDPTYILLDNGAQDIRRKYAVCHCRNCGAPSTLRLGFETKCKYCDAEILYSTHKNL